jgi:hypothetical protein
MASFFDGVPVPDGGRLLRTVMRVLDDLQESEAPQLRPKRVAAASNGAAIVARVDYGLCGVPIKKSKRKPPGSPCGLPASGPGEPCLRHKEME